MNIYSTAILISIVIYIAIGNYAGRKVKDVEDYFVVGRQAPTLFIVGTLVASLLSTSTFLAESGAAYGFNTGGWMLWPAVSLSGYIYGALFFGRYLRRSRAITVAEYFGQRFNSRRVQVIAGLTVVVGLGCYLVAVTQGSAIVLSNLTELSYTQALIVAWASYTSFTLYSGSRGVVITDTLMFLLFTLVSFLALYSVLNAHGGWMAAMEGLVNLESKPGLMSWHGIVGPGRDWETPLDYLIWISIIAAAWSLVTAISPWQSSRYLMAKNEHVVLRSACIATISIASIQLMLFAAATTVNLSKSDIFPYEEVMIWAARNIMSPMLGAIVLAGVVAAALSSATTFLSLVGFNVSNDIVQFKHKDEASKLRFSRAMMLLVGVIALAVSVFVQPQIFWLTYFAGTLFASAWGPVALMSVWSDRITASAAFWGIAAGFVGNVVPKVLKSLGYIELPSYLNPILIGVVASLLVVLWVSGRGEVTEKERSYRLSMLITPQEEIDPVSAKKTLWAAYALGAFGVLIAIILMVFYVYPYQIATAGDGDYKGFNWFSGEALFVYGWGILYPFCAVLMYRGIRGSYFEKTSGRQLGQK